MAIAEIPWPVNALPGRRPGEAQGDLLNAYAMKRGDIIEIRRTPGLVREITISPEADRVPRGMFATPSMLLHAWDDELYVHRVDGTNELVNGELLGADRVTFAANLQVPAEIVIATELGTYVYNQDTNMLGPYTDGPDGTVSGSLGAVDTVEYYSGYFFFSRLNGEIIASKLQSTEVEPLSYAVAEYSDDLLLRLKSNGANLLAFGQRTTEIWIDVGSSPFPCQRQTALDVGLLGKWSVAGGAHEWERGIVWVASDYSVRILDGFTPKIISNDDVSHSIFQYRDRPHEVVAQVYNFEQQAVFSITTPDWTWEYNVSTGGWHRRDSYGMPHWRATSTTMFGGCWYAQDLYTGRVLEVLPGVYTEDGETMRARVESAPLKQFPASIRIPAIDIDASVGLGHLNVPSPYETNPALMVSWSHDGGANWSRPLTRSLGREGRYANKVTVNNLGRSTHHGTRIRLELIDPVPLVVTSAVSTRTRGSRARQVDK